MKAIVKSISIFTAFRVGFVVQLIFNFTFGCLLFWLWTALIGIVQPGRFMVGDTPTTYVVSNILQTLLIFVLVAVFSAVAVGIVWAMLAFSYNIAAAAAGGLQLQLVKARVTVEEDNQQPSKTSYFNEK